jgi:hypothetical protein
MLGGVILSRDPIDRNFQILEAKVFLILGRFFGLFPNQIKVPSFLSLVLQPQLLWEHNPCLYSHFIGYVGRGGSTQC